LSRSAASGTNTRMDADAETQPQNASRRSDRWAAEPARSGLNWWAILAVVAVLAGYGVSALVAAAVKGNVEVGDDAGLALVGATPALAALGVALGLVGRRRGGLRWLAWIAIVLGVLLVIASIAVIVVVTLAFRTFS
jgi:hypothetical protein